jgi:hypothetical protein
LTSEIRKRFLQLQFLIMCQAARKSLDLLRLGDGVASRLCAALMLSTVFFLTFLLIGFLTQFGALFAASLGLTAALSTFTTSAVLVLYSSDKELDKERPRIELKLKRLREAASERKKEEQETREAESTDVKSRLPDFELGDEDDSADSPERDRREPEPERRERRRREESPSGRRQPTRTCPYCMEEIQVDALKCKHCGEILDEGLRTSRKRENYSRGLAAILSFFIPGLGQMYKGEIVGGLIWFFVVCFTYPCCGIGFVVHVLCILSAGS